MKLGVNQIAMLYYAGGLLLMKGISLLMLPVLTHLLAPREYGQLEVLLTIINLGSLILGFGLVDALYRFAGMAADEGERKQVVARVFGLVWIIALASLVLLWWLAPLVQRLLLQRVDSLGPLWNNAKLETLRMADVLQAR